MKNDAVVATYWIEFNDSFQNKDGNNFPIREEDYKK